MMRLQPGSAGFCRVPALWRWFHQCYRARLVPSNESVQVLHTLRTFGFVLDVLEVQVI